MPASVRRLTAADAKRYWAARNDALAAHPDAFTSTHEEGLATSPEKLAKRFGGEGDDNFMLGAFAEDGSLLGYIGFERETRAKLRHKGAIISMFVDARARGQGLGARLLDEAIAQARRLAGLEQLWLSVTHSNDSARQLYLRAGFVSYGVEPRAIKDGERYFDKEFMVLRFDAAPSPTLRG